MQSTASGSILECVLCGDRFGEQDVRDLKYFPSTQVCYHCYDKGQQAGYVVWCFGKRNLESPDGKVLQYGFDTETKVCREECPDRKICKLFLIGALGGTMKKKAVEDEGPVRMGRGPAVYKGLRLPFKEVNSIGCLAFVKCMNGIMITDLVKWVQQRGGDPRRVLRLMRSGNLYGRRWRVDEANGFLKIDYRGGDEMEEEA